MQTNQKDDLFEFISTQKQNTLNDSLLDAFSCTFSQLEQPVSPKRKPTDALQAPQAPKTRNKLSLLKKKENTIAVENNMNEKIFENDAEIFCTENLKKIDMESMEFQETSKLEGKKLIKYFRV